MSELKISITPDQLRLAREALTRFAGVVADVSERVRLACPDVSHPGYERVVTCAVQAAMEHPIPYSAFTYAQQALDALPPYLNAYELTDDDERFWYAAPSAAVAKELHRESCHKLGRDYHAKDLHVVWVLPHAMLTVHDTEGVVGAMARSAEDWANTNGEPYLIASTVASLHMSANVLELHPRPPKRH